MKTINVKTTEGRGNHATKSVVSAIRVPENMVEAVKSDGENVVFQLYLDSRIIRFRSQVHADLNNGVPSEKITKRDYLGWRPVLGRAKMTGAERLTRDLAKATPDDRTTALIEMAVKQGHDRKWAEQTFRPKK